MQVVYAHCIQPKGDDMAAVKHEVIKKEVSKPKPLTEDEKAQVVLEYLGVHPKYFIYEGQQIKIDIWTMQHDGINWRGWRIEEMKGGEWKGK